MFYQDVVAMIVPNTIKMSPMDHQCFLSNTKAHVNYYNCSLQDFPCKASAHSAFTDAAKRYPKMRYKIKEIFGDYYYEEMSIEETVRKGIQTVESDDKLLHCQKDICNFVRDNMS